jgi:hypothetical protein
MGRKRPEFEEFIFWVRHPSIYYSFSLQRDRWQDDPYDEAGSVSFDVECIHPVRCKGRNAKAEFHADPNLIHGSELRLKPRTAPKAVASIVLGKVKFDVGGHLPPSTCWRLASAIAAGTIASMLANAHWTGRGHAWVNSVSFHGPEFDPTEYIG